MSDEMSCGKGLAEHSAVPLRIAQLLKALAENLALHQKTVDLPDPASRREFTAYVSLTNGFREVGERLLWLAREMAAYRTLPVAPHDEDAMNDPAMIDAFAAFAAAQQELLGALEEAVKRDQAMLDTMKS